MVGVPVMAPLAVPMARPAGRPVAVQVVMVAADGCRGRGGQGGDGGARDVGLVPGLVNEAGLVSVQVKLAEAE